MPSLLALCSQIFPFHPHDHETMVHVQSSQPDYATHQYEPALDVLQIQHSRNTIVPETTAEKAPLQHTETDQNFKKNVSLGQDCHANLHFPVCPPRSLDERRPYVPTTNDLTEHLLKFKSQLKLGITAKHDHVGIGMEFKSRTLIFLTRFYYFMKLVRS